MQDRHESNLEQLSAHLRENGVSRINHEQLSSAAYVAAVSQHLERLRRQPPGTSRRHI